MIADRYFVVQPDQCRGYKSILIPDHDVLPLDILPNCKQLVTLKDGRIIIHCRLGDIQINNMRKIAEVKNPLSLEAVKLLGLVGSYAGQTRKEVLAMFPELDKYKTYTDIETGKKYRRHVFPKHKWM